MKRSRLSKKGFATEIRVAGWRVVCDSRA